VHGNNNSADSCKLLQPLLLLLVLVGSLPPCSAAQVDQPPRWCVGCRGGHTADIPPDWQPYTPLQRLVNSHLLPGTFQAAAR
jgi:hypothetical protein